MHPYKIQIFQKLQPGDFDRRVQFCEWFLQKLEDPDFLGGLIMSDQAHFSLKWMRQQAKHAILGERKSNGNNGCAVTF